jgi:hypothetical protein
MKIDLCLLIELSPRNDDVPFGVEEEVEERQRVNEL